MIFRFQIFLGCSVFITFCASHSSDPTQDLKNQSIIAKRFVNFSNPNQIKVDQIWFNTPEDGLFELDESELPIFEYNNQTSYMGTSKKQKWREKSDELFRNPRQSNKDCYKQTCEQVITGRQLNYKRALKIIQDEEYISAADKDIIRRIDVEKSFVTKRRKRATTDATILNLFSSPYIQSLCPYFYSGGSAAVYTQLTIDLTPICAGIAVGTQYPTNPDTCGCALDSACVGPLPSTAIGGGTCVSDLSHLLEHLVEECCPVPVVAAFAAVNEDRVEFRDNRNFFDFLREGGPIGGSLAAGGVANAPVMPMLTGQGIPPGNPSVGSFFGGGVPTVGIAALALVPLGLIPVAVFPPYAKTRTKPAVAVIFSENPNLMRINNELTRIKRSLFGKNLRRGQRRPTKLMYTIKRVFRKIKKFFQPLKKKIKNLYGHVRCLKTRIMMYMKGMRRIRKANKSKKTHHYKKKHLTIFQRARKFLKEKFRKIKKLKQTDDDMNSMDDCFEDMPEPKYGIRVNVTIAQDSPCTLETTCRGTPEDDSGLSLNNTLSSIDQASGLLSNSSEYESYNILTEISNFFVDVFETSPSSSKEIYNDSLTRNNSEMKFQFQNQTFEVSNTSKITAQNETLDYPNINKFDVDNEVEFDDLNNQDFKDLSLIPEEKMRPRIIRKRYLTKSDPDSYYVYKGKLLFEVPIEDRQSGEEFKSDGPPECRVTKDPKSDCRRL